MCLISSSPDRPAALRRNGESRERLCRSHSVLKYEARAGSVSRDLFAHPSPPLSPSIAVTESRSSSWLTSLAGPFSPTLANANDASKELGSGGAGTAVVRGYMIPRSQWKVSHWVRPYHLDSVCMLILVRFHSPTIQQTNARTLTARSGLT